MSPNSLPSPPFDKTRKSEACTKIPSDATYNEHVYSNRLREHPYTSIPLPSHQGVSAPPWRQEGTLLSGYSWHQTPTSALGSFNAPHYPPADDTPYPTYQYPPVVRASDSLQTSIPLTYHTQGVASSLHAYHQSRESNIYEQLGRAVAAAPLHGMAAPRSLRDLYSVPVVPQLPPLRDYPSVASQFLPMSVPGSSDLLYTSGATAPGAQYFPPQHGSLPFPQHQGSEAVEARALVEASMRPSKKKVKPREKRRQQNRTAEPFPVRLFRLLSDLESSDENQGIASFTASGQAFQILKPLEFMKDVAPRYFRQKPFCSFTRQLNCYRFEKASHGPDKGAFSHPMFQRDKPELCKSITAKVAEDYRSARVAEMHKPDDSTTHF
jgi:hypothetical protein